MINVALEVNGYSSVSMNCIRSAARQEVHSRAAKEKEERHHIDDWTIVEVQLMVCVG